MTKSWDFFLLYDHFVTYRTMLSWCKTRFSTGCFHSNGFIAVTQCCNFVCNIAVITDAAGIGGVAAFSTVRSGYGCFITMTLCFDDFHIRIAAMAGVSDGAVRSAGGVLGNGFVSMAQCCNLIADIAFTAVAGMGGVAFGYAGGGSYNALIVVTQCVHIAVGISIAAGSAGMGGIAFAFAGGGSDLGHVDMAQSLNG